MNYRKQKLWCIGKLHIITQKKLFVLLVIIVLAFISSCRKKDGIPPSIMLGTTSGFICNDTIMPAGTNFFVRIIAQKGDENITNLVIKNYHDGQQTILFDTGVNNETLDISKILTKNVYQNETFTFMVIDKKGENASVSFTVSIDSSAGYQVVKVFNGVVLGAQKCITAGSFMSLASGHVWFQADACTIPDTIEMLYYYDSTGDANTISSANANIGSFIYPGATSPIYWPVRNETKFYKTAYSLADFSAIVNDSLLLAAYSEINAKRKAKNLVAGDVYSFKTVHTKYGMFAVEQVTGADSGTVRCTIKIQK
ncbi:MAG TPA: hypothetical protein PKN48_05255 [Bacteroidales bacterium]|nr:hypothetical protein [Bacteroidales bacterium]